jgi:hypothetical protein
VLLMHPMRARVRTAYVQLRTPAAR